MSTKTPFETFLASHDEEAWSATLTTLLRSIHEVDKTATQIWFSFYPLGLFRAVQHAEDPEELSRQMLLQGKYYLKDQVDSSHRFLYGHRYWPEVKKTVGSYAASFQPSPNSSLADQILDISREAAKRLKVDVSLTIGITAVALMTVEQVGLSAFI